MPAVRVRCGEIDALVAASHLWGYALRRRTDLPPNRGTAGAPAVGTGGASCRAAPGLARAGIATVPRQRTRCWRLAAAGAPQQRTATH